jgi:hypothetical protein
MKNCKNWGKVDCDEIPEASWAKQRNERTQNCVLYCAKIIKIGQKHESCMNSANQSPNQAERNERNKACDKELEASFYKFVDLYHEKLTNQKHN